MSNLPTVFCVYMNPADYPGKIVIRRWVGNDPSPHPEVVASNINAAREELLKANPGLVKLDRCKDDDPAILETWI